MSTSPTAWQGKHQEKKLLGLNKVDAKTNWQGLAVDYPGCPKCIIYLNTEEDKWVFGDEKQYFALPASPTSPV